MHIAVNITLTLLKLYLFLLLSCFVAKAAIQMDTQHPEGMKKIQQLEQPQQSRPDEPEREFEKPIFTQVLTGPSELWEGQHAHYEARVVPVGDPSLRFEWYINGVELKMGKRIILIINLLLPTAYTAENVYISL